MAEDRRLKQIASLSQDELYQLAMIDELTGVYNRRELLTYLDELIKSAELNNGTVSLLVLDIDKFKSINDTYGHLTGDKAIVEIANFRKKPGIHLLSKQPGRQEYIHEKNSL